MKSATRSLLAVLLSSSLAQPCVAASENSPVTMEDIKALEAQLADLKRRFLQQSPPKDKPKSERQHKAIKQAEKHTHTVDVYATMRPTFGRIEDRGENQYDVRDALSHAGVKATHQFNEDWAAELHGEWSIDVQNTGEFGRSRRAYTALVTPIGRFGIGKQRPAQYLFIAEYVDIFNHANSPFAYDPESIFFVDNLISYRLESGPLTFVAVGQFDGAENENNNDLFNTGLSYDKDGLHAAVTYQMNEVYDQQTHLGENSIWAAAFAYDFTDKLYAAVAYQDKTYERHNLADRDGSTFDLSFAYKLGKHYKLKTGYFDFDDGYDDNDPSNQSFDGFNITLEWLPTPPLRVHLEYLTKSYTNDQDFDSLSVGFRYDFRTSIKY
ncbi:porin [Pseudoalteromonas luteoviolacea]|uniref:porin n=1 Tax=Pseudoalteromonas luteoviolacea TaxID=43657 RepID=UPI001B39B9EF|nr:porin [Pseudoalteromonas luteoviolacea]MBQ4814335.1 porin [Pseudoalteromonas luteoviolacea]